MEARYLGSQLTHNGTPAATVRKRICMAKKAFYNVGSILKRLGDQKSKIWMFKGLVVNTLLSGLEAELLRGCDHRVLETCMLALARKT